MQNASFSHSSSAGYDLGVIITWNVDKGSLEKRDQKFDPEELGKLIARGQRWGWKHIFEQQKCENESIGIQ